MRRIPRVQRNGRFTPHFEFLSGVAQAMSDQAVERASNGTTLQIGSGVLLRMPRMSDADEFIDLMYASRRLHRRCVTPPLDAERYREYVQKSRASDFLGMLVCRVADERILGVYNLSQIVFGPFQNAYLGYYVGAAFSQQGYMREAMQLVLRHAFRGLGLHRLEANIQPENTRSIRLVERSGFEREGFSPRYLKIGNRWRDHERWAIRKETWRAVVAISPGLLDEESSQLAPTSPRNRIRPICEF